MPDETDTPAAPSRRQVFGGRLRELRTQAGRSQADVARAAGLDRAYYVGVEAGKRNISLDNVFALADALAVDIVELFTPPQTK
ncbi:helix-turn-helix domain-containing protein [Streptomyces marianii]|uniref:Helix-turn-helix transcriptional regulator n=1 Tax=Streptomyces marianii TaxID=1817406 RepID=A0A5R9DRL6_9ACTN|nr:helix-turn-helix transcriptional regulator [Streptomyces marianii]TLQ39230.1 helix-turn-helix transcriptional regulator [Streptomyces marianii]